MSNASETRARGRGRRRDRRGRRGRRARPRSAARIHDILHPNATLGPLFVLLLAVVYFAITADRFLEPANLSLIVQQVMVVGTLGIAQTLVILTAGIDLSVGAIMVLSSIVMAKLSARPGPAGPARAAARLRRRHRLRPHQRRCWSRV